MEKETVMSQMGKSQNGWRGQKRSGWPRERFTTLNFVRGAELAFCNHCSGERSQGHPLRF
jgi:hypothetical protein